MKIKDTYKVRQVAGENLVVEQGRDRTDMTRVISLNASALLLWNQLAGRSFTLDDAAAILSNRYGISSAQALADAKRWADSLTRCGIIE